MRLLLCLVLLALPHAAPAMQFGVEAGLVTATGKVVRGDSERLAAALRALPGDARVSGLALDSPGGDLDEGLRLAEMVRRLRLPTVVRGRAVCASACFLVFAAGARLYASTAALVGVHSAASQDGDTPEAQAATVRMARRLAEYGVPDAVLGKTVATAPSEVWWLTRADLAAMRVTLDALPSGSVLVGSPVAVGAAPVVREGYRVEPAARGFVVERPAAGFRVWRPGAAG